LKEIKLDDMTASEVRSISLEVKDLQAAETVSSATITHEPPSGSALVIPNTISTPYIYMLFGPFDVTGRHIITVQAVGSAASPSKPETIFYVDVVALWAGRK
jgi:hypothetical protein